MDEVNLERKAKRKRRKQRYQESAVGRVGKEKPIRKEGKKERLGAQGRSENLTVAKGERDVFKKRKLWDSERVTSSFPYVQLSQRLGIHLKDPLRRDYTYFFCTQQSILLGNFLEHYKGCQKIPSPTPSFSQRETSNKKVVYAGFSLGNRAQDSLGHSNRNTE